MDQDLEDILARASDPRWIPAIYSYCDHRCARCRFNDRCFSFSEQTRAGRTHRDAAEAMAASSEQTLRLVQAFAEREGIDRKASEPKETDEATESYDDPLATRAREYALAAWQLLRPLESPPARATMPRDVRDAIESILWLSTLIASKVFRAVTSLADPPSTDDHPTQNDAHGSAKVARLMIAESRAAWRVLNEKGCAPGDSPTRQVAATLERIDHELAARIPRAMEFVRPGFDEPIPGVARPWSLTSDDERSDRRFRIGGAILARLGGFGRRLWERRTRTVNARSVNGTNRSPRSKDRGLTVFFD